MKRALVAAYALALVWVLFGCGGNDEPEGDPAQSTLSPTVSSSPTPTNDVGGPPTDWESKFTQAELTAGKNALARWQESAPLLDEIHRNGRLTPGAKATLQEYDFWWQRDIVTLGETYDKGGLRLVEGVSPVVLREVGADSKRWQDRRSSHRQCTTTSRCATPETGSPEDQQTKAPRDPAADHDDKAGQRTRLDALRDRTEGQEVMRRGVSAAAAAVTAVCRQQHRGDPLQHQPALHGRTALLTRSILRRDFASPTPSRGTLGTLTRRSGRAWRWA